jgi:hypothetical protein
MAEPSSAPGTRPGSLQLVAFKVAVALFSIVALKSMIFPDPLSGVTVPWAVAALAWVACYLIAGELGVGRTARPERITQQEKGP